MLEIGFVVDGKYKILNQIGQGGMSIVYLAMVEKANKQWAVKEIRKDGIYQDETVRKSLVTEIHLLKKLSNPHLPSIVDVIDNEETLLIVMDYIEGITLKEVLKEYGAQRQEDVIDWARQLCDVLGYLHSRVPPIIYRDMKPSNIMLKPDGQIVLIDFGIAREFKRECEGDTSWLGTKGYAAPEQFGGCGQTDGRTDLYSLGVTLYHLLTGHNPGKPPYEMYPIREWNPELSPELEKIILKCTRANPKDRYQSCEELLYELNHYEELNEIYQKKQKAKVWKFLALCLVSVFFIGSSISTFVREKQITADHYWNYMEQADMEASDRARIDDYKKAIFLAPKKEEAYLALIHTFVQDDIFSVEEDKMFSVLLHSYVEDGQDTFLKILKKNRRGYPKVAYSLGMAYWYYYEQESARKMLSVKWFQDAAKGTFSEEEFYKQVRAGTLSRIGRYYRDLGKKNVAGDTKFTYQDYWKDLQVLLEDNIVEKDNVITALRLYEEVSGQICIHTKEFQDEGVKEKELSGMLDFVERAVYQLKIDKNNRKMATELIGRIQNNINLGRKKIFSTYHQMKEGKEEVSWNK